MYASPDVVAAFASHQPPMTRRPDFDEFWTLSLDRARQQDLRLQMQPIDYPAPHVEVRDLVFCGWDDTPIHSWLLLPKTTTGPFPCLVHFDGYGGNRGFPYEFLSWLGLGCAVLSVDLREQSGSTGTKAHFSSGAFPSVISKGLLDKNEYYYRAVYLDCVQALDVIARCPELDSNRIILEGGSQGGALSLIVAALDSRPWRVMADVPSMSQIEERVRCSQGAFEWVTAYLKLYPQHTEQVLSTLSYFDTMNFADRIRCPVLASVALQDQTAPARLFQATYNRITSPKTQVIYPYNGHEGGGRHHHELKLRWLQEELLEH